MRLQGLHGPFVDLICQFGCERPCTSPLFKIQTSSNPSFWIWTIRSWNGGVDGSLWADEMREEGGKDGPKRIKTKLKNCVCVCSMQALQWVLPFDPSLFSLGMSSCCIDDTVVSFGMNASNCNSPHIHIWLAYRENSFFSFSPSDRLAVGNTTSRKGSGGFSLASSCSVVVDAIALFRRCYHGWFKCSQTQERSDPSLTATT